MNLQSLIRWTARLLSLASTILLVQFAFSGGERPPSAIEWTAIAFFPIGVVVGFAVAWRKERLGGLISLASLGAFYVVMYVRSGTLAIGPYFALFALPAPLFLLASCRFRHGGDSSFSAPRASSNS